MLSTILAILAIGYLPGAVIFRLPIAERPKRAALPAEERVFWSVMLSLIVSTSTAFVLAAIGMYSLAALVASDVALAVILALVAAGNLRLGPSPKPGWTATIPPALIAASVWMSFAVPPSEWIAGGRDPGVYMNEGIQIAQRGSLLTTDAVAADVPGDVRDLFFPFSDDSSYYSVRFMGFHLRDADRGTVSGQFPQGYPIWIAIAYGLDGLTGTRLTTAWWAILGVLAVYFAASRLIGPIAGGAAAGLLAVHVIQTWYARYPNSEIVTQALLFGALLAHAYAHEDDDLFFGPVAASLLGLALFTRFPVVVAVGAAVVASVLPRASQGTRRARAVFLVTLAGWIAAALVYYMTQLRPYFMRPIMYVLLLQPIHLLALAAAGAATCALLWVIRKPVHAAIARQWLPPALVAAVTAFGIYAFWFREPAGRLAPHDAHALRMFVNLYLTPGAFVLALIGFALMVWRSFWRAPALILATTAFAFFFFYKIRIVPEHFWLARRFLDVILPTTLMCAAAAALFPLSRISLASWASRPSVQVVRLVTGLVIVGLLGREYLEASQQIRAHVEYAGLIPRLEQLASRFDDNDLVIFEAREASDVHVLALPLAYVYARNVLVLYRSRPDKRAVSVFLTWARERYKDVYFIAGGGTDLLGPGIGATVVESVRFQVPEFERTDQDIYPRQVLMKPFDFTIYGLVAGPSTPAPHSLDVGGEDDLHLVDFFPKERLGGRTVTFRWSQGTSYLLLGIEAGSRQIALRMSAGRPKAVPAPRVTLVLEGRELGTVEPGNEFRDYTFDISAALAAELAQRTGPSEIRLLSSTWTPRDALGGSDPRALGVMVDSVEVR